MSDRIRTGNRLAPSFETLVSESNAGRAVPLQATSVPIRSDAAGRGKPRRCPPCQRSLSTDWDAQLHGGGLQRVGNRRPLLERANVSFRALNPARPKSAWGRLLSAEPASARVGIGRYRTP